MKVYVDDMIVKSKHTKEYVIHLSGTFDILQKYGMELNPNKCAFRVGSGNFLEFMVNQRRIEANLEKIKALLEKSPL